MHADSSIDTKNSKMEAFFFFIKRCVSPVMFYLSPVTNSNKHRPPDNSPTMPQSNGKQGFQEGTDNL